MTPPRRAPQVFRPGFSDPGLHRLKPGAPGLDFQTWDSPSTPDKADHTTRVPQVWIFRPGILHQPLTKQITQPGCPRSGFSDRGFHRPPRASANPSQHRNKANPTSAAYNYHPIRHNATNGEISRWIQPAPTREPTPQQPCSCQEIGGNFPHPRTRIFFNPLRRINPISTQYPPASTGHAAARSIPLRNTYHPPVLGNIYVYYVVNS